MCLFQQAVPCSGVGLAMALLQFGYTPAAPGSSMQHLQGFNKILLHLGKFQVPQLVPSHMHKSLNW